MSDKTAAASEIDSPADLRGTLIKRLAVAGVLVAVLLGVLAFFDYLATPDEPEPTVYTKPVPVPPKKEMTQPVKPAATLPEPPRPEAEPEKPAEAPAVAEPPPPKPVVPAQPAASAPEPRAEAKPVPAMRPASPVPAQPQVTKPASPAPTAPEPAAAPKTAAPVEPATTPVATAKATEVAAPHLQPLPAPRLFSGYVLQAGVFTNVQRAEELHAKLTLNGIPSTLEARVQVGPFKSRAEADAAREKMRSLGIDTVFIPPHGSRR